MPNGFKFSEHREDLCDVNERERERPVVHPNNGLWTAAMSLLRKS